MKQLSAVLALVAFSLAAHCSLSNQEGPPADCALLECGRINACADGIIAQCADGKTLEYRVCSTDDVCTLEWQVTGQFRCSQEATDCEGCRPEREGCDDPELLGGSGGTGGSSTNGFGAGGSGSGAGGSGAGGAGGTGGA